MSEIAEGGYRELCSWLTIRHTLMIIGWEDVSGAESEKCTAFFFFFLPKIPFITALFPLSSSEELTGSRQKGAIESGWRMWLPSGRRSNRKDCIVSHCVMLPQICNYSVYCLLQCMGQFICILQLNSKDILWLDKNVHLLLFSPYLNWKHSVEFRLHFSCSTDSTNEEK